MLLRKSSQRLSKGMKERRGIKAGRQVKLANAAKSHIDMISKIILQPLPVDQTR